MCAAAPSGVPDTPPAVAGDGCPAVRALVAGWPDELREQWEERAAVRQWDAGLSASEADRLAAEDVMATS